jgi:hypothetical protein
MVTVICGGSNEIDVKEFTVMPCRTSPNWEQTTLTPVAHLRIAWRNCSPTEMMNPYYPFIEP